MKLSQVIQEIICNEDPSREWEVSFVDGGYQLENNDRVTFFLPRDAVKQPYKQFGAAGLAIVLHTIIKIEVDIDLCCSTHVS